MKNKEFVKPVNGEVIAEGRISQMQYFLQKRTLILVLLGVFLTPFLTNLLKFGMEILDFKEAPTTIGYLTGFAIIIFFGFAMYIFFWFLGMYLMEIFTMRVDRIELVFNESGLYLRKKNSAHTLNLYHNYKVILTGGSVLLSDIKGVREIMCKSYLRHYDSYGGFSRVDIKAKFSDQIFDIETVYEIPLKKKFIINNNEFENFIKFQRIDFLLNDSVVHIQKYNEIFELVLSIDCVTNELYDFVMMGYSYPDSNICFPKYFGIEEAEVYWRKKVFLEKLKKITGNNYQFANIDAIDFVKHSLARIYSSEVSESIAKRLEKDGERLCLYLPKY